MRTSKPTSSSDWEGRCNRIFRPARIRKRVVLASGQDAIKVKCLDEGFGNGQNSGLVTSRHRTPPLIVYKNELLSFAG